ncbi:MAG: ankyrin repeat domain-containing protein, partial [Verrucomicrobiales bacterium]
SDAEPSAKRSISASAIATIALVIFFGGGLSIFLAKLGKFEGPNDRMSALASKMGDGKSPVLTSITKKRTYPAEFDATFSPTPAGICEAARSGDLALIKKILAGNPELLKASNPHNWAGLPEMRVHPWASRPVEIATIFGHADVVAYLLGISETDYDGNPASCYYEALEIAQKMKNPAVLKAIEDDFIRRITDEPELVQFRESNGSSILHFAAGHSNLRLMEELLKRGADPLSATNEGRQAIHYVIGDNDQTRLLLEYGQDYNLWIAAALGDLDRAKKILAEDPSQLDFDFHPSSIHSSGMPIVMAASGGKLEMVRLLIEQGADVNGQLPGREFADKGLGLLHALTNGHIDIVHLLLDHGADVDAWVDSNYDFKYRVKETGDQDLMERVFTEEELAEAPKSPSFTAWTGEIVGDIRKLPPRAPKDALGVINAALVSHNRHHPYANYKEIITVMLEQGADQNAAMNPTPEQIEEAPNRRYWHREWGTPLHWLSTAYLNKANYSPNPDIPTRDELVDLAGLFVTHGADLEARHPISNHTPLSSAVEKGIAEYVDFLLENGAQIHHDDPPGTNPVEIAKRLGFKEIAELLSQ